MAGSFDLARRQVQRPAILYGCRRKNLKANGNSGA
jgi:hypothetical protein